MKKHKIFFLVVLLLASGAFYFSAEHFGWHQTASVGSDKAKRSVAEQQMYGSGLYGNGNGGAFSVDYFDRTEQEDTSCRTFELDELQETHEGLNLLNIVGMTDAQIQESYPVTEGGYSEADVQTLIDYKNCFNDRPVPVAEVAFDGVDGIRYPWWSELTPQLTADLESHYDVFFLVNTQQQHSPTDPNSVESLLRFSFSNAGPLGIPRQHVKIIVRKGPGPIFERNAQGVITGVVEENIDTEVASLAGLNELSDQLSSEYLGIRSEDTGISESYLLPSTTGVNGDGGMKTVNGIFNLNFQRSRVRWNIPSYRVESAPMSHPLYLLTHYSRGQESGIAIHGTPRGNRPRLGVRRGSHGCARVHPDHALTLANWIFNEVPRKKVPVLNWRSYEAYNSEHNRSAWRGAGSPEVALTEQEIPPVLFVVFNGNE